MKAKLILSGVALFAIVGGALAFKANRSALPKLYYTYTTAIAGPTLYSSYPTLVKTTVHPDVTATTTSTSTLWYTTGTPTTFSSIAPGVKIGIVPAE